MAKSYLIPAKNRKNLHISYNSEVQKILIDENNQVTGVVMTQNGQNKTVNAKKEVIMSAGSIMSPKLLMLSGIGPKEHLNEVNIPVKVDLPVGKNYIEHIIVRLFISFAPNSTEITTTSTATSQLDDLYNLLVHNTGPFTSQVRQLMGFIDSRNRTNFTDTSIHFNYFPPNTNVTSSVYTIYSDKLRDYFNEISKTNDIGYIDIDLVQPKSRGFIQLNKTSINDKPILRPNFVSDEEDIHAIIRSSNQMLALLDTKTLKEKQAKLLKIPLEACDALEYMSFEYWRCYIHQIGYPPSHSVGTSKMGTDSDSVVDPRLKVRGVTRLRQIDGGM